MDKEPMKKQHLEQGMRSESDGVQWDEDNKTVQVMNEEQFESIVPNQELSTQTVPPPPPPPPPMHTEGFSLSTPATSATTGFQLGSLGAKTTGGLTLGRTTSTSATGFGASTVGLGATAPASTGGLTLAVAHQDIPDQATSLPVRIKDVTPKTPSTSRTPRKNQQEAPRFYPVVKDKGPDPQVTQLVKTKQPTVAKGQSVPSKYLKFYSLNNCNTLKTYKRVDVILAESEDRPQERAQVIISPEKNVEKENYYMVLLDKSVKIQRSSDSAVVVVTIYPKSQLIDAGKFTVNDELVKAFFDAPTESLDVTRESPTKKRRLSISGFVKNKRKLENRVEIEVTTDEENDSGVVSKFWSNDMMKTEIVEEGRRYLFKNLETTRYLEGPVTLVSTPETKIEMDAELSQIRCPISGADLSSLEKKNEEMMTVVLQDQGFKMMKDLWIEKQLKIDEEEYTFTITGNIISDVEVTPEDL